MKSVRQNSGSSYHGNYKSQDDGQSDCSSNSRVDRRTREKEKDLTNFIGVLPGTMSIWKYD